MALVGAFTDAKVEQLYTALAQTAEGGLISFASEGALQHLSQECTLLARLQLTTIPGKDGGQIVGLSRTDRGLTLPTIIPHG